MSKCLHRLAEEAAAFQRWLEQELPQADGTVGRRLVELAESSFVSGLFCLFLQRRFADLFRDAGGGTGGRPHQRAQSESGVRFDRRSSWISTRRWSGCGNRFRPPPKNRNRRTSRRMRQNAARQSFRQLLPLLHLAAHGMKREAAKSTFPLGKPRYRFLGAKGVFSDARQKLLELMEFVGVTSPGSFPPLRCDYRFCPPSRGCPRSGRGHRFSRRGGVMLSPQIAVPISTLFGDESGVALAREFPRRGGRPAPCRVVAAGWGHAFRQCLPYIESNESRSRQGRGSPPAARAAMSSCWPCRRPRWR